MNQRAAERILRTLLLSTLIGVVLVVVAAIVVSDHRGVLLLIGAVYLLTSLAAYFTLRRSLERELARQRQEPREP